MKPKPKVTLLTAPGKVELWTRGERFAVYLPDAPVPGFESLTIMGCRVLTQTAANGLALYLRHGNINGIAFGTENANGHIVSEEFMARRGSQSVGFQHRLRYVAPDNTLIMTETRTVRVVPSPSEGSILDVTLELQASPDAPVIFEPSADSFLTLHAAQEFTLANNGQMRNSLGDYGAEALHGRAARWAGVVGVVQNETVGMVWLDHSGNLWYPSLWVACGDGTLSPSGVAWRRYELPANQILPLRYRLQTHVGYVDQGWADARLLEFLRDTQEFSAIDLR